MKFNIRNITKGKKRYLDLLLIGDEQERMIDRYIDRGEMYVLFISDTAAGVCVITKESNGLIEIRNIAILPEYRRKGFGRSLLEFVERLYNGYDILVG